MKRMRNVVPSLESQNPSTFNRSLEPALPNEPVTAASVKGFWTPGESVCMVIST